MTIEEIIKEAKKYAGIILSVDIDAEERYYNGNITKYDAFIAGANFAQSQSTNRIEELEKCLTITKNSREFNINQAQRYKEALERIAPKLEEIRIEVAKTFAALSSERIDRMIYELSIEIFKVLDNEALNQK